MNRITSYLKADEFLQDALPVEVSTHEGRQIEELDYEINARIIRLQLQLQLIRRRLMVKIPSLMRIIMSHDECVTEEVAREHAKARVREKFMEASALCWRQIACLREEQKVRRARILSP